MNRLLIRLLMVMAIVGAGAQPGDRAKPRRNRARHIWCRAPGCDD